MNQTFDIIVTMAFGLEKVVKQELLNLGYQPGRTADGRIELEGGWSDIARLNLWLRAADRVVIKLKEYRARNFDELFDGALNIPWGEWIAPDAKITVVGQVTRSAINSVRASQSMIKKAILESLKKSHQVKLFPESAYEAVIKININKDNALLTLDTTGAGLHKRGYRRQTGEAPMRENLAAGLVMLSFWRSDRMLLDPMCGSGTIAIEAAMIARQIAPGLNRSFGCEQWPMVPGNIFEQARTQARDEIRDDITLEIAASDIDPARVADARENASAAGVDDNIEFSQRDVKDIKLSSAYGVMISNPPYGIKLGSQPELITLYKSLRAVFNDQPGWSIYILTADRQFANVFRADKPDRIRKLYNGNVEANYYQYHGQRPPRKEPHAL